MKFAKIHHIDAENDAQRNQWPKAVIDRFKAVARVEVHISSLIKGEKYYSEGSGTIVEPHLVLTAFHALPRYDELIMSPRLDIKVFMNGKEYKGRLPCASYYDVVHDLALIELSQKVHINPIPIAKRDPLLGEKLYTIGYSYPERPIALATTYKGHMRATGTQLLLTSPSVEFGYSGAPLLNSAGEMVGTIKSVSQHGIFSSSVSWNHIQDLLAKVYTPSC